MSVRCSEVLVSGGRYGIKGSYRDDPSGASGRDPRGGRRTWPFRYVTEALRSKRDRDKLQELVHWLEEEHGPVTEDERSTAYAELDDLDAEHTSRATQNKRAGEAA